MVELQSWSHYWRTQIRKRDKSSWQWKNGNLSILWWVQIWNFWQDIEEVNRLTQRYDGLKVLLKLKAAPATNVATTTYCSNASCHLVCSKLGLHLFFNETMIPSTHPGCTRVIYEWRTLMVCCSGWPGPTQSPELSPPEKSWDELTMKRYWSCWYPETV